MNIGIISSRYTASLKHDAGRAVYSFAHGLAEQGHKVTVYTYNSTRVTKKMRDFNVTILSIGGISNNNKKLGLLYEDVDPWNVSVWDELEHEDTTELILLFDWFGFDAARAHRKLYDSKIIGLVGVLANGKGGFGPFTDIVKLKDYKEKELEFLHDCDSLIAFNKCSYNEVKKFTKTHCSIINLGVDATESGHHSEEDGRVLVVGRISRDKCLELLFRAIAELNWVSLTVCGSGKDSDYGKYLIKLATKIDLNFKLDFVDSEPGPYYAKAEMVVCPSVYDPFGYGIMDAYNLGVPVIGHYASYADMIKQDSGMLFQSVGELVSCLHDLHTNKALRESYVRRGHDVVSSQYSYIDSIANLVKVLA